MRVADSFKIEQATIDVVLTEDEEYLIEVVGKKCVVHKQTYVSFSYQLHAPKHRALDR